MNKASKIIERLSERAREALAAADGVTQGSQVWIADGGPDGATRDELAMEKLIGPRGGLTMLGSIVAETMRDNLIEEMFA